MCYPISSMYLLPALLLLLSSLLLVPSANAQSLNPDLNGDNRVDFKDVNLLIQNFSSYSIFIFNRIAASYGQILTASPTPLPVTPPPVSGSEWNQFAHDAQNTGFTPDEPGNSWAFAWHFQPSNYASMPRQAHAVTGSGYLYMPGGTSGLYIINQSSGQSQTLSGTFNSAGAYDPTRNTLFIGSPNGRLYRIKNNSIDSLSYDAKSPVNHAVILASGFAYITTDDGKLHKVNPDSMSAVWIYSPPASPSAATPAAYSVTNDILIYGSKDLFVQAVNNSSGSLKWRVKPTSLSAGDCYSYSYENGWPVVADLANTVFMRIRLGDNDTWLWSTGEKGRFPTANAEIKSYLNSNSQSKPLFALDLTTGSEKFTPAVGNGGVDDVFTNSCGTGAGKTYSTIGPMPVVKTIGSKQFAYLPWRNGQVTDSAWDGRWDGHMGEMVLDNSSVAGYSAGDMRFITFSGGAINNGIIADEMTPVTVAGNTIFHAHWGASESFTITDRSDAKGSSLTNQITTRQNPLVIRRLDGSKTSNLNTSLRQANNALPLFCDGRYFTWYPQDHPGAAYSFYSFLNQVDPPATCSQVSNSYGDGMRPRYTFVSDGNIYIVGNGGDIFALTYAH